VKSCPLDGPVVKNKSVREAPVLQARGRFAVVFLVFGILLVQAGLHIPRNDPSSLSRPSISQPSFRERAGIAGQFPTPYD